MRHALALAVGFAVAAAGVSAGLHWVKPHQVRHVAEREGREASGEMAESLKRQQWLMMRTAAPYKSVPEGAYAAAVRQAAVLPAVGSAWQPVGIGPLHADNSSYDTSSTGSLSQLGLKQLSGRVSSFAYDPAKAGHYFVSTSSGGVYESNDSGQTWSSIGESLPTQVVGAIAYSAPRHTLIVGTGDNASGGGYVVSGMGAYYSTDDGATWVHASGIPDGLTSFKIALDPADTSGSILYLASSRGLWRSTDGGASYTNVNLPVGPAKSGGASCAGVTDAVARPDCTFASFVTDVAVRTPDANGVNAHKVIAAVGWIFGQKQDVSYTVASGTPGTPSGDGVVQGPQNGIYVSNDGSSFTFVNPGNSAPTTNGFAPTPNVGRVALAVAHGANQNHDVVYAMVSDAMLVRGCSTFIDIGLGCQAPGTVPALALATTFDALFSSTDFGKTWQRVVDAQQLRLPGTGSALQVGVLGYGPGVQSWYNLWVDADPTVADSSGIPTRVIFGLEEIWENDANPSGSGVNGSNTFHTIGRYWDACLQELTGVNCANAGSPIPGSTTHPDQHAGVLVPLPTGGVTLLAGNDGGAYLQSIASGSDFSNDSWGNGNQIGLHTLLPYAVDIAKDGTVVAGLQDNGEMKIDPTGTQNEVFGGDGFFTGIDPDNSKNILEEYADGAISVSNDGGVTWNGITPNTLTNPQFSMPLQRDPGDAKHYLTGAREVYETDSGYVQVCPPPDTTCQNSNGNWTKVYDLGTWQHPGDASQPANANGTADPSASTTATDVNGNNAYVGFCAPCSARANGTFDNGIATNVGASQAGTMLTGNGWHIAHRNNLPSRFISSLRMDPQHPSTIYLTLAGYSNHWVAPGQYGDIIQRAGTGHVFVSTDAGDNFTDVSGNLPDAPANWVLVQNGQLVVATDVGAFISDSIGPNASYSRLGTGLPNVPVAMLTTQPGSTNRMLAATYGRGIQSYSFASNSSSSSSGGSSSSGSSSGSSSSGGTSSGSSSGGSSSSSSGGTSGGGGGGGGSASLALLLPLAGAAVTRRRRRR